MMNREEFLAKTRPGTNGCLEWVPRPKKSASGQQTNQIRGYGLAHRVSWELFVGELPGNRKIKRVCGNRNCVEPEHLYVEGRPSPEKTAATAAAWHAAHQDQVSEYKRRYRFKNQEALRMQGRERARRDNRAKKEALASRPRPETCEICAGPEGPRNRAMHFDHCHKTGKFRGWLCARCNLALGTTGDDPSLLRKLAAYLEAQG